MESVWLTVGGLTADIIGFAIITLDVLPEYRLYRRKAESDEQHRALLHAARASRETELSLAGAQRLGEFMAVGDLESTRRRLRLPEVPITNEHGDIDPEVVERSRTEVDEAIGQRRAELDKRTRPPVMLGVALIFLGFGGQIAGTLLSAYRMS